MSLLEVFLFIIMYILCSAQWNSHFFIYLLSISEIVGITSFRRMLVHLLE